ncbi:MAG: helix-turn-helix domain-containing protein [Flavobacteriaceae bacterium]|nr:helix-turn-helix domain-containing protein [Flavobacteriaceae bacterium]
MHIALTISQVVLGLVLISVFHNLKSQLKSERILFWYLLLLMLRGIIAVLGMMDEVIMAFPRIILINQPLYFLDAAFLYIFVRAILRKRIWVWQTYVILLPFVLYTIYMLYVGIRFPWDEKFIAHLLELNKKDERVMGASGIIYIISMIILNFIVYTHSFLFLRRHRTDNGKDLKVVNQLNAQWQRQLVTWWFLLICFPTVVILTLTSVKFNPGINFELLSPLCILLLTFVFGIRNLKIKIDELREDKTAINPKTITRETPKYGTLKLSKDRIQAINMDINKVIEKDKVFLEPELTLASFAGKFDSKPYIISQVINTIYGKSFQDFINSHRIEYAKRLLKKNPDYKIIHIAFDSGFKSKATFNQHFKNKTGCTPTEFKTKALSGKTLQTHD